MLHDEKLKQEPYTRAIFPNMCKGILPEDVRTQAKFSSGAMTLAFAVYWEKKQLEDFKDHQIEDRLNLFNQEKLKKPPESYDLIGGVIIVSPSGSYISKNSPKGE